MLKYKEIEVFEIKNDKLEIEGWIEIVNLVNSKTL